MVPHSPPYVSEFLLAYNIVPFVDESLLVTGLFIFGKSNTCDSYQKAHYSQEECMHLKRQEEQQSFFER